MSANVAWLAVAVLLILSAHAVRAIRWSFLFPKTHAQRDRTGLLLGLGMGYAVNALIPLRAGELVRALVASKLRGSRMAETLATIVAERVADLLVLAVLLSATWQIAADPVFAFRTAALFGGVAVAICVASWAILRWPATRRLVWRLANLFNSRVRLGLADFVWSTAEILAGKTLLGWRFTVTTIAMWTLYGGAYLAFSHATGAGMGQVIEAMLQHPFNSLTIGVGNAAEAVGRLPYYTFVLAPVLLIVLLDMLVRRAPVARVALPLTRLGKSGRASHGARSERFTAPGYDDFLDALFSNARSAVSGFGMRAVDDGVVRRFFHGGSDALTALVETPDRLLIRKFAMGAAATRLESQADWLRRHASPSRPLVGIIGRRKQSGAFSYDMPVIEGATDFYDAIHSGTYAHNRALLSQVLTTVDTLHGETCEGTASQAIVDRYFDEKIAANAVAVSYFAEQAIGSAEYSVNGTAFDLDEWRLLSDRDWVSRQLRRRDVATVHGDLTVENLIVAPSLDHGLYIIDPNPENVFNSPLIDWAKMMQSLHLGYEQLNRTASCSPSQQCLSVPLARSEAYAALHGVLEDEARARFGEEGLREIYFHELVNYLRLTPYKIRQSADRGLAFFACTSMILRRYRERFA